MIDDGAPDWPKWCRVCEGPCEAADAFKAGAEDAVTRVTGLLTAFQHCAETTGDGEDEPEERETDATVAP